jgi:SAM-dependent MidA family methyltransferase
LDNWLEEPGLTDLSSAVHWDHLIETGESLGMKTLELVSQERFLMGIIRNLQNENRVRLAASAQENSPAESGGILTLPAQALKTLIHPQYLGHSFQALVQERKVIS